MRFSKIQRAVADASPKMLSTSLRNLEEDGIVVRKVYPEVPPRVEYRLTERGEGLLASMEPLIAWADSHMEEIMHERLVRQQQRPLIEG